MNEKELTHIDLFSGIGGFTLAGEWAGFRTVAFCEKEEFCQKVLQKRFGAIVADSECGRLKKSCGQSYSSRTFQQGKEAQREKPKIRGATNPISTSNKNGIPIIPEIRDFDGTKYRDAILLTGGFPCQPFSVAGQRRGKEDDRYLWPEMLRVISEAKPRWILAENVFGIVKMALDTVLADLEGEGYITGTFIIPACSLNAPHKRNRIWIIAYSESRGIQRRPISIRQRQSRQATCNTKRSHQDASDSNQKRLQIGEMFKENIQQECPSFIRDVWEKDWHEVAAQFCRVDDGIPNRVDRLKALGNAIVPQIAYEIMEKIAWIERNLIK